MSRGRGPGPGSSLPETVLPHTSPTGAALRASRADPRHPAPRGPPAPGPAPPGTGGRRHRPLPSPGMERETGSLPPLPGTVLTGEKAFGDNRPRQSIRQVGGGGLGVRKPLAAVGRRIVKKTGFTFFTESAHVLEDEFQA